MDFDVHLNNIPIGMISSMQCNSSEQAQRRVFGGIPCEMHFFENQIQNFKYPLFVLSYIKINDPNKGLGTMAMKKFHQWAKMQGMFFGILKIGIEGDDYDTEFARKVRFFERVGWKCLQTPKIENLSSEWKYGSGPTDQWMYCNLDECLIEDNNITFIAKNDLFFKIHHENRNRDGDLCH